MCRATGTHIGCWWECKTVKPLWETVWNFLQLNLCLLYDPAVAVLGIPPNELKTKPVFTAASLNNCQRLETTQVPTTEERTGPSIQWTTTQQKEGNELVSHAATWMNLLCIFLRVRSQTQKATYYMRPFTGFWKRQNEYRKQTSGWEWGKGSTLKGSHQGIFRHWERLLWHSGGGFVSIHASKPKERYTQEWLCIHIKIRSARILEGFLFRM